MALDRCLHADATYFVAFFITIMPRIRIISYFQCMCNSEWSFVSVLLSTSLASSCFG